MRPPARFGQLPRHKDVVVWDLNPRRGAGIVLKRVIVVLAGLSIVLALVVWGAGRGWFGSHEEPGEVTALSRAPDVVASRAIASRAYC